MGDRDRPFRGTHAVAAGRLTEYRLKRDYERMYRDVYVRKGTEITARMRALATAEFCRGDCVLTGLSAAAMYGTKWLDPKAPSEVVRPQRCISPRGMVIRQSRLRDDEVTTIAGIQVTTAVRTAFDIARMLPRRDAIVVLDALCRATKLTPADVVKFAEKRPGARNISVVRSVLAAVDPGAESPPETDLRLLLVDSGLPRPKTQVYVVDEGGGFIARCDLGWPEWRVIVEYDGSDQHWGRAARADDIDRYALIQRYGWTVVRVSSRLLYGRRHELLERVEEALRAAGARG